MNIFKIEVTDTYAGEANYCWVKRYKIKAKSFRGAMQKLSRANGGNWRVVENYGDMARYNQKGACICAFVDWYDEYYDDQLYLIEL